MGAAIGSWNWPELSGREMATGNTLFGASGRIFAEFEGKRFRVSFVPAFAAPYQPLLSAAIWIDGRKAGLDMDRLPLTHLLGYPGGGLDAADLPAEVLAAFLEGALAGILAEAERTLGKPVRIESAGLHRPQGDWEGAGKALLMELDEMGAAAAAHAPERLRARLHLSAEDMEALAGRLRPEPTGAGEWGALPVDLRFRVGAARLTVLECGGLAAGDIVLLEGDPIGPGGLKVCAGDADAALWTATWKEGRVVLEEGKVENMEQSGSQGGESGNSETAERVDALEVQMTFDLGGRTATLAEVRALTAGHVFALPENPEARVGIRVGGKPVGSGTLVMVDGRAGVRIDTLWKGTSDAG
jgi:type III secretion system YscQ/HrcQ family protein